MKTELIDFLNHIANKYKFEREDFHNLEMWIQTIEGYNLNDYKDFNQFIGKTIRDFYCNGFFGRRYDLEGSVIINISYNRLSIRDTSDNVVSAHFEEGWQRNEMFELIEEWTKAPEWE